MSERGQGRNTFLGFAAGFGLRGSHGNDAETPCGREQVGLSGLEESEGKFGVGRETQKRRGEVLGIAVEGMGFGLRGSVVRDYRTVISAERRSH